METKWLSIQSFQKNQQLIAAINTLSMHLKLKALGMGEEEHEEIKAAKNEIGEFLSGLQSVLQEYESNEQQAIPGVNPRLRELAQQFSRLRHAKEKMPNGAQFSLEQVRLWLNSNDPKEVEDLLQALHELRSLLAEHNQITSRNIIPGF